MHTYEWYHQGKSSPTSMAYVIVRSQFIKMYVSASTCDSDGMDVSVEKSICSGIYCYSILYAANRI